MKSKETIKEKSILKKYWKKIQDCWKDRVKENVKNWEKWKVYKYVEYMKRISENGKEKIWF